MSFWMWWLKRQLIVIGIMSTLSLAVFGVVASFLIDTVFLWLTIGIVVGLLGVLGCLGLYFLILDWIDYFKEQRKVYEKIMEKCKE